MKNIILALITLISLYGCNKEGFNNNPQQSLTNYSIRFENSVLTQLDEPILSIQSNNSTTYNNSVGSFYTININIEQLYSDRNIDVFIFEQNTLNQTSNKHYIGSFITTNNGLLNIYFNGNFANIELYYIPNTKYYILLSNK